MTVVAEDKDTDPANRNIRYNITAGNIKDSFKIEPTVRTFSGEILLFLFIEREKEEARVFEAVAAVSSRPDRLDISCSDQLVDPK